MIRRSLKWIIPTLVLICVDISAREAQAQGVFVMGNDLVKWMEACKKCENFQSYIFAGQCMQFTGYVIGVHDANPLRYSLPEGVTQGRVCAIVSKFLKEHPEKCSAPAASLVIEALKKAFPKNKVIEMDNRSSPLLVLRAGVLF